MHTVLVLAAYFRTAAWAKLDVLLSVVTIQIIASCVNMFPELNTYYSSLISAALLLITLMVTSYLFNPERKRRTEKKEELPKENA